MNKAVNMHFVSVGEGVVMGRVSHVQSQIWDRLEERSFKGS